MRRRANGRRERNSRDGSSYGNGEESERWGRRERREWRKRTEQVHGGVPRMQVRGCTIGCGIARVSWEREGQRRDAATAGLQVLWGSERESVMWGTGEEWRDE